MEFEPLKDPVVVALVALFKDRRFLLDHFHGRVYRDITTTDGQTFICQRPSGECDKMSREYVRLNLLTVSELEAAQKYIESLQALPRLADISQLSLFE